MIEEGREYTGLQHNPSQVRAVPIEPFTRGVGFTRHDIAPNHSTLRVNDTDEGLLQS